MSRWANAAKARILSRRAGELEVRASDLVWMSGEGARRSAASCPYQCPTSSQGLWVEALADALGIMTTERRPESDRRGGKAGSDLISGRALSSPGNWPLPGQS